MGDVFDIAHQRKACWADDKAGSEIAKNASHTEAARDRDRDDGSD